MKIDNQVGIKQTIKTNASWVPAVIQKKVAAIKIVPGAKLTIVPHSVHLNNPLKRLCKSRRRQEVTVITAKRQGEIRLTLAKTNVL